MNGVAINQQGLTESPYYDLRSNVLTKYIYVCTCMMHAKHREAKNM